MPIKLIHVSDIHFGSGEGHGCLNPKTGLNVRFEDFCQAFSRSVDFALKSNADVFLFSGDAYKTPSPEPLYQKAFAVQLKRLSESGISTVLLVGNHDQILKAGSSHSMSVFQSLEIPGVEVIERPNLLRLKSKNGVLQLIGMPHVTRHLLMTQKKYANLAQSEIDRVLVQHTAEILRDLYDNLDPALPACLTAHMMVDSARAGAEQELMVGYAMTFPISMLIDERLDYVALGHVHAHQVLREAKPLIAYAGSIERVDFSEEKEDKGFIELDIERGNVKHRFHSISPRPFITIDLDLTGSADPSNELFEKAKARAKAGAVCRIKYKIEQNRLPELDEERVRQALNTKLLSLRFKPQLVLDERPRRMPDINEKAVLQPLQALDKYLSEKSVEDKESLLERARDLIERIKGDD